MIFGVFKQVGSIVIAIVRSMEKTTKIVGVIVAVFLLILIFTPVSKISATDLSNAVVVQLADTRVEGQTSSLSDSVVLQLTETHTDSQIDINVKLFTNTGISSMTLELYYNRSIFEYNNYDRGTALSDFDLMVTDLSQDPTLPIKFNWFNQDVENDFSKGSILRIHFNLKSNCPSGQYEIGFINSDATYIDNGNPYRKSAIASKAVIDIAKNKISETEIVDGPISEGVSSTLLVVGIVVAVISASVAVTLILVKRKNRKGRKKDWLKI